MEGDMDLERRKYTVEGNLFVIRGECVVRDGYVIEFHWMLTRLQLTINMGLVMSRTHFEMVVR